MRWVSALCVAVGLASVACDHAPEGDGADLAHLQFGVQGLYENTGEIDLKAGKYVVKANAEATGTSIEAKVSVFAAGSATASIEMPFSIPNTQIAKGLTANTQQDVTLLAGQTALVTLQLMFGVGGGVNPDAAMDIALNVSQDKAAPTINYFHIYPGPTFSAGQAFNIEVFATNNYDANKLQVDAVINGGSVTLVFNAETGRYMGTLKAPGTLGSYTLQVKASDGRGAGGTTTDSKTITVK